MAISVQKIQQFKPQGRPLVVLTAWDWLSGEIVDLAGADIVLVGDSLATAVMGYRTTLPLNLDAIIYHAQAVCRGVQKALIVVDLPFLSYQESVSQAIASAGRVLKETEAQAVKLEGASPAMLETITRLIQVGIPVMGHIGLTPQSLRQIGLRQQGRNADEQEQLIQAAIALESAGVFAMVLEHIPADLAQQISQKVSVPTIGIGAGPHCDGQVLVTADLLGLTPKQPPFAKVYADLRGQAIAAVKAFGSEVREHRFERPEPGNPPT